MPLPFTGLNHKLLRLGSGLAMLPSGIKNAGLGVYLTIPVAKNQIITEYTGQRMSRQEAMQKRMIGEDTHMVGVDFDEVIDGIYMQDGLCAAFVNDAINSKFANNTTFYRKGNRVFLKAKDAIPAGSELFVSYGMMYWQIHWSKLNSMTTGG